MPVANITGAASGIGLALSRQFTEQGWNVTLADVDVLGGQRAAEELSDQTFFRKTDVSNWDDVASLLYEKNDGEPQKPNLRTIDIGLNGQIYCLYLAAHYFRQNGWNGGTIVFTSSNAGLYKLPTNPQYAAARYGIIGLVRSVAPVFQKETLGWSIDSSRWHGEESSKLWEGAYN
ncbi:hypothetical protein V2G26_005276 [Clonostachys chloroleuca]